MMNPSKNKKNIHQRGKQSKNSKSENYAIANRPDNVNKARELQPMHALIAKDSEWVDAIHTTRRSMAVTRASASSNPSDERIIPLDESLGETPFAAMFPGLVQRDPQTLEGIVSKTMSTTEITRRLVNLDEKADFIVTKKVERLIPKDKLCLEPLMENSQLENATISTNNENSSLTQTTSRQSGVSEERFLNELFFFRKSNNVNNKK